MESGDAPAVGQGPLRHLTVIDASSIIAGPLAGMLLRLFGARVIKVEQPGVGDAVRTMGMKGAETSFWTFLSQDKECISCKLSDPRGAALLKDLVAKADVFIESFRPGTLERWGLSPAELQESNPDLAVVRISGFGQSGPHASRPGYGTLAEARSGFAHVTGEPDGPPTLPGFPVGDTITGLMAALACLAACLDRARDDGTDPGPVVEVSLYESLTFFLTPLLLEHQMTGVPPRRRGNRAFGAAPRNTARCADGDWVAYSVQSPGLVAKLLVVLGAQDDERFADYATMARHGDALDDLLLAWISERDRPTVLAELTGADIPVAPVNDAAGVLDDEQLLARGDIVPALHEVFGKLTMLASPAWIDGWRSAPRAAGFQVGQHNADVYGGLLGLGPADLEALASDGVI